MADVMEPPVREPAKAGDQIVIDGEFLKDQAGEAVETFLAPLAGVVAAASGRRFGFGFGFGRRRRAKRRAA
jgi:hypothetical protein